MLKTKEVTESETLAPKVKSTGGGNGNLNSFANLVRFTPENARANQAASTASRMAKKEALEALKLSAKVYNQLMSELPPMSALDVMRMAMQSALLKDNFEDAVRYAALIAEYEQPKLQRIEQNSTTRTVEMSDEELRVIIAEEGLKKLT